MAAEESKLVKFDAEGQTVWLDLSKIDYAKSPAKGQLVLHVAGDSLILTHDDCAKVTVMLDRLAGSAE